MIWELIPPILILVALLAIPVIEWTIRKRNLRQLSRSGRTIHLADALRRLQQGNGRLIENHTSLPGDLYWIPVADAATPELYDLVKSHGLIIIQSSVRQARAELERHGLSDRLTELHAALVD